MRFRKLPAALAMAISAMTLAMCSRTPMSTPTSPGAVAPSTSNLVGDLTNSTAVPGKVKICKTGNTANGTFTVSSTGNNTTVSSPYVVANNECRVAAEASDVTGGNVTVTETSASFQSATVVNENGVSSAFTNGTPLFINTIHGFTITFTNFVEEPPPPPPPGDEGCTPGYWKQDHHFDSWPAAYKPGDDFDATFGVDFFNPNITLVEAAGLGGGGTAALARHAVAALLNAASSDVDYKYTTAEVLAIVQGTGTYAGLSVEARKNLLAAANETTCPLN